MLKKILIAFIALALPLLLVVTSIRVIASDWFIHFEYSRPDFPPDQFGFTLEQRTPLALIGMQSVLPDSQGIVLLERATLPDGSPAFNEREIGHMTDVRVLISKVYPIELIGLALIVILAVLLNRSIHWRDAVPNGLLLGSILTLAILGMLIAYIFVNFDSFFLQFHQLFFQGTTFMFLFTDTLIRLYPVQFWSDAAITIGAMTTVCALFLLIGSIWWLRRLKKANVIASKARQSLDRI
ncbi:MAG TPA: TIGR01906 family membrane protein [Anaerolineae bacterium]|nr:TIGR01906 family membrane protein [Anaerolineae bacterium]